MPSLTLLDVQREIDTRQLPWQAGSTCVADLPHEMRLRRLGLRMEPTEQERLRQAFARATVVSASYPATFDWRNVQGQDWTTPIRDQGACGSCVAFGTLGALECIVKYAGGDPSRAVDLSEAHLFFCGCGACCDQGWWPGYALDYVKEQGVPDEACFPYRDSNQSCSRTCTDWSRRAVRIAGWREVYRPEERKQWLSNTGAMVAAMAVYDDFYYYTGGVYYPVSTSLLGHHAVAVVGYDESLKAWICKNSWGTGWGERGWFRIAYGTCKLDTEFPFWGIDQVLRPASAPAPEAKGCNPVARLRGALKGG